MSIQSQAFEDHRAGKKSAVESGLQSLSLSQLREMNQDLHEVANIVNSLMVVKLYVESEN